MTDPDHPTTYRPLDDLELADATGYVAPQTSQPARYHTDSACRSRPARARPIDHEEINARGLTECSWCANAVTQTDDRRRALRWEVGGDD
jgi:hypothetical protein